MSLVEGVSEDEVQHVMNVNFHGPHQVIQAATERASALRSKLFSLANI